MRKLLCFSYPFTNQVKWVDYCISGNKINQALSRLWLSTCCLLLGLFLSTTSQAQIPAGCGNTTCTSNDVQIVRAYLRDINGNALSCSGSDPISQFVLHLIVSTKTPRIGVFINCKFNVTSGNTTTTTQISNCFNVALTGTNNDLPVTFNQAIACGSSATLTEAFTSWGTGNTSFCPGSCPGTPSKCRFVPGEVIIVETFPCTAPSITSSPTDQTKCAGDATSFSVVYTDNTGGHITTSVVWQKCTNGTCSTDADWTDLTNTSPYSTVTTSTLNISSVTGLSGTKYRAKVTNTSDDPNTSQQVCTSFSSAATLTVNVASAGGTVASAQTVCSGNQPANDLTLSSNTGNVVRWERSTVSNFSSGVTNISNTTTTLTAAEIGALTQDTWFRAVVKNGVCPSANSSAVKISVDAVSVGGTVASAQSVCSGNQPANDLTLSSNTGNVVRWERSTDNFVSDVTNISNTTTTLSKTTIGALTQDTWFRAVVKNGVCASANSTPVQITVNGYPDAPTVSTVNPTCSTSHGTITVTAPVGASYLYSYNNGDFTSSTGPFSFLAGAGYSIVAKNTSTGCISTATSCAAEVIAPVPNGALSLLGESTSSQTTVKAYPNPFNDRVKFVITSSAAGDGNLDVYNMMGQKVKTVYTGFIAAGTHTFELSLPTQQVSNLIYVLRIGDKKMTGKLLQVNQ